MLTMTLLLALSAAEPLAPQKLGVSVAAGTLGSPEGHGVALSTGIRWGLGSHFALGFDTGYGLMGQQPGLQDRWWLMPSAAVVFRPGPLQLDVGLGVGAGTSSAFTSVQKLSRDQPIWAFQLMPALRGHVRASIALSPNIELFTRADVGGLLMNIDGLGFSEGNYAPNAADSTWANLWVGLQFRLQ